MNEKTAAAAHARMNGHELLCIEQAKHTQRALETMEEAVKSLSRRINKLISSMVCLMLSVAGASIFMLLQWLWEARAYS